jgi:tetratricopeptide (TPR) repeat protein
MRIMLIAFSFEGYICQELDEYEEALGYYRKALQIFLKNHGKIHIDVSNTMNNLATLFDDLDEYEEVGVLPREYLLLS